MQPRDYFNGYFDEINTHLHQGDSEQLAQVAKLIKQVDSTGKKVMLFGNGGSSGIASHLTVDLVNAAGIRATCYSDAGLLTCLANDYGYQAWVEKTIEFYGDSGDLAVLISSSGQSMNMVNGATKASKLDLSVVTLSGFLADNPLRQLGDVNLWLDSSTYNVVETVHNVWMLAVIDFIIAGQQ
jgi:D-sedoheptulose 7-phosphate isomerase